MKKVILILILFSMAGLVWSKDRDRAWQTGKLISIERKTEVEYTSGLISERFLASYDEYTIEYGDRFVVIAVNFRITTPVDINGPIQFMIGDPGKKGRDRDLVYFLDRKGREHGGPIVKQGTKKGVE